MSDQSPQTEGEADGDEVGERDFSLVERHKALLVAEVYLQPDAPPIRPQTKTWLIDVLGPDYTRQDVRRALTEGDEDG